MQEKFSYSVERYMLSKEMIAIKFRPEVTSKGRLGSIREHSLVALRNVLERGSLLCDKTMSCPSLFHMFLCVFYFTIKKVKRKQKRLQNIGLNVCKPCMLYI